MAEISNKTLAFLLIAAIVISVGGTFVSLNRLGRLGRFAPGVTGFASDQGVLSLTIQENIEINFTQNIMDWGTGAVDTGKTTCLLQTNLTNGTGAGNNCTQEAFTDPGNFVVENKGNRNVTLNITGSTADTFFKVSGGSYKFNITNKPGETACVDVNGDSFWVGNQDNTPWTSFEGATEIAICNETGYGMRFEDGNDEFYINIQLILPYTSYGLLSDNIILEATTHKK